MKHCIMLSPFSGRLSDKEKEDLRLSTPAYLDVDDILAFKEAARAVEYAQYRDECLAELLHTGYAPFASHAIYPQVLDDSLPEERELGMQAGYVIYKALLPCYVCVCDDHGISSGMAEEIAWFETQGATILYRTKGWNR